MSTRIGIAAAAIVISLASTIAAQAADKLRIGKPEATGFDFAPVEVGIEMGIFAKHNIEAESIAFGGAAREQQALIAGSLDIALGSGLEMAAIVKGAPEKAVAAMYGAPYNMCIVVLPNSPIKETAQLKGKTIAVSSPASLTAWVAKQVSTREGWGPDGVKLVGLGSIEGMTAQMFSGNVDASVDSTENAYLIQSQGRARVLVSMGQIIPDFLTHVIFASNDLIAKNPALLRRFLVAWFDIIAYMNAHEDESLRITNKVTGLTPELAKIVYKEQMPQFSKDGRFDPKAVAVVRQTFSDLALLDNPPDMKTLYTEEFLPPR
jgi:ABC-type nitrate/sulfonate/bicarbonate transport system substrate-binding protein